MHLRTSTMALSAAGLLALGTATGLSAPALFQKTVVETPAAPAEAPIPPMVTPNYRAIVARNQAAVVGITTAGDLKTAAPPGFDPGGQNDDDGPLSQFFQRLPQQPRSRAMHAQGSGFIISADGLVLTNAHVVDGAKEVTVKLSDRREYKAKVLGSDKSSDIAVIKIEAHGLTTVNLGDSDKLGVGDYVLAIGQPFGLEETATAGIVSAKGRSLPGDGYVPFIQTDAAVNPGKSGGPLFDDGGRVVGINSQIYSNSGGYQGVSFAIPINVALQVKDQIVKTGKVAHARLGIEIQSMNQSLADSFKLKTPSGALVAKVDPDGAAARAGLKAGDIVVKFNGDLIPDAGALSARVGSATPGDTVRLEIMRDGRTEEISAAIGAAQDGNVAASRDAESKRGKLGLAVRPLSPEERRQSGLSAGLLVEDAQGHAAEAGIQPGDVLLSLNGTPIESVAQLRKLVDQQGQQVALLIQRGESRLFVPVGLG
jgi:serine protease Do